MLAELLKQAVFSNEYQRHQHVRDENQSLLEGRLQEIRRGDARDTLEPFAKAYLGMFDDINNNIPSEARIYLLVDEPLAEPIIQGLVNALQQQGLPGVANIAAALINNDRLGIGYIALAGFDLFLRHEGQVAQLSPDCIKAIICFHYANATYHPDDWLTPLLQAAPDIAAEAFIEFWSVLRERHYAYLPGLKEILENDDLLTLRNKVIVTAVSLMRNKRPKELARMLLAALNSNSCQELSATSAEVLQDSDALGMRQQVYWQAIAFILDPARHGNILSAFVVQEKIKILPLLDFINEVLVENEGRLSGEAIGELIRIIAPKFTPQLDNHGNLSDVTQKVAWLFYLLAIKTTLPAMQVTKKLRRLRVFKLYSEVLDEVESLQQQLATDAVSEAPDADSFIRQLHASGKLKSKKKWTDTNF